MKSPHVPSPIAAYLTKRGVGDTWTLHTVADRLFTGAIVIPSLAEATNLPLTLEFLSRNPGHLLDDFLILIVVNQRADASVPETADNLATVRTLPFWKQQYNVNNLFWIDAASPGMELPPKQGVGLARKIGLDLALPLLDYEAADPLLICLDADTLVQPDYLSAITRHFSTSTAGGTSIPYRHLPADTDAGRNAIERYELFLRIYVLGLKSAASPYAFHTVGSAMACRASSYVDSGGMNRRQAGEDFYFLQQLHKTAGVDALTGTVVHPSPRTSQRVPFGTGRAVGDMLKDGEERLMFYHPDVFRITGEWLECVKRCSSLDGTALIERAGLIAPALRSYLEQAGFVEAWDSLRYQKPPGERLMAAFHEWFDAFRTMKLIHFLSDHTYLRVPPESGVPPLLERAGFSSPPDLRGQLELLRSLQGAESAMSFTSLAGK